MSGFFTKKETESKSRPDGKTYSCISCGLHKTCKSPKMEPFGNFKKKILNIGEAPGEVEDQRGKPFQGKTGTALKDAYKKLGIDLFEDCLNLNAVNCRPEGNRSPENYEIECCRKSILTVIEQYKPKVIILLGNSAIYSMIGHRWKKDLGGVTKWRGFQIPDQDFKAWVCPTFHPSYIERSDSKDVDVIWQQDLQAAFDKLKEPFPLYKEPTIHVIEDLSVLNDIQSGEIAFDYETTGIKPHADGHRIICASVATSPDTAYVFLMPDNRAERRPFINLLLNQKVGKIAQNMKYEHAWSLVRLKTEVQNWVWDTMLAAHILDNRPGVTGLKFQVYVNFGVVDYASELAYYLQTTDTNSGNAINRIKDVFFKPGGKQRLLKYCGLDAIYEYRLAEKQRANILPF